MEREFIVLLEDLKDKASYGFMATPTPKGYVKKTQKVMDVTNNEFNVMDKENNFLFEISYKNIKKVVISLCSRISSSSGFGGGLTTVVHIDFDIEMNDGSIYAFEVVRPDSFDSVFDILNRHAIVIEDPLKVQSIYTQMTSAGPRSKYLSGNFGKMARKYKLDHPRK